MSTAESMKDVFVRVLGVDPADDPGAWKFAEVSSWDSLAHMELVSAVEDAFGVLLDTDAVVGLDSFDAAVRLVEESKAA